MSTTTTPARAYATVTGTTATFTAPDGHTEKVSAAPGEDIRATVVRHATTHTQHTGTPVVLVTSGDRGEHRLLIRPDGHIGPAPDNTSPETPAADRPTPRLRRTPEPLELAPPEDDTLEVEHRAAERVPRPSFVAPSDPLSPVVPAGWRGMLARLGVSVHSSAAQAAKAQREAAVSQHWAGCRSIAVVNGKGGVGKTITTAMLAAVFARYGGGNVLAWDNNDTRGTLGWRTEQGLYDTTLRDLLPAAPDLLSPFAGVSDITRYVHHQSADRYDVLRSNPELLATDQRISQPEFDLLMQVAARFYRLVIFDSGNDESAERWLRMIDSSARLVLPTLVSPEPAESASLLLDALRNRDDRSRQLAENAVVIITHAEPARPAELHKIIDGFADQVAHVAVIPYDRALKSGPLRFDALAPRTRDAWVTAAAHTAEQL